MTPILLKREGDPEGAEKLRELADLIESGDCREYAVLANDLKGNCYRTIVAFDDRWRFIGALENAKSRAAMNGWKE